MSKVLVVTGGSRGIGAAVCSLAAADGWSVCVNYLSNKDEAQKVVNSIERLGGRAIAVKGDVSSAEDTRQIFEETAQKLGSISGLVNSAGITGVSKPFLDIDADRWAAIMGINVMGTVHCTQLATHEMIQIGGGTIVNLSSMASVFGAPGEAVDYAASKGAVDVLTVGLSKELAKHSIRVNAVRPGLIDTDMQAASGDPERAFRLAPTIPLQRPGRADEVAEAIVWLLSDKASYVTGAILTVSGGR